MIRSIMEADKFVCKFCNKKYPCGKSLGGHLRSHRLARAAEINRRIQFEPVRPKPKVSALNALSGSEAYVLRENPKKTKRFADSGGGSVQQERFCKECGKGFQSMKALCGHMACHSEKVTMVMSKFCSYDDDDDDDCSVFDEKKKEKHGVMVMDSQSDTETSSAPRRGKRSKRVRYKNLEFNSNGSSSVSEIEQEQEEVAMCLMMLSRDSSYGKSLNLVNVSSNFADQSSDNNSVVLEAKSSSIDMKLMSGFNFKSTHEVVAGGTENNSDSGYFRNGPKNVKSDVSVDGFARNCGFGGFKDGFESLDQLGKRGSKKLKHLKKESAIDSTRGEGYDRVRVASKTGNGNACTDPKRTKLLRFTSHDKSFNRAKNYKINGCSESICESGENSIEADSFSGPNHCSTKAKVNKYRNMSSDQDLGKAKKRLLGTKKSKGHECPICFRVFKSGQALGGHKRSHFIGGSHDDRTVVVLAKQDVPEISGLIDLNLPAPEDS